jgi:hypothetical protein
MRGCIHSVAVGGTSTYMTKFVGNMVRIMINNVSCSYWHPTHLLYEGMRLQACGMAP